MHFHVKSSRFWLFKNWNSYNFKTSLNISTRPTQVKSTYLGLNFLFHAPVHPCPFLKVTAISFFKYPVTRKFYVKMHEIFQFLKIQIFIFQCLTYHFFNCLVISPSKIEPYLTVFLWFLSVFWFSASLINSLFRCRNPHSAHVFYAWSLWHIYTFLLFATYKSQRQRLLACVPF